MIDAMPRFTGTYANGTISFKPQCKGLAMHLLDANHQRPDQPMANNVFQSIKWRIEACNAAY